MLGTAQYNYNSKVIIPFITQYNNTQVMMLRLYWKKNLLHVWNDFYCWECPHNNYYYHNYFYLLLCPSITSPYIHVVKVKFSTFELNVLMNHIHYYTKSQSFTECADVITVYTLLHKMGKFSVKPHNHMELLFTIFSIKQ